MKLETFCKVAAYMANQPMYKQAGDDYDPLKYTKNFALGSAAGGAAIPALLSTIILAKQGVKPSLMDLKAAGLLTGAVGAATGATGAAVGGGVDLARYLAQ